MTLPAPYYDEGGITIYHGDCRDILPHLPKVDLVLTDPPYGIGADGGMGGDNLGVASRYEDTWDERPPTDETLRLCIASAEKAVLWGGNYFGLPGTSCWFVWDKDRTGNYADCELAWTNLPGAVRRLRFRWNGMIQEYGGRDKEPRFHPTQKPVPLMRWCLSRVPDAVTVLDPFMGSGTTLVAAKLDNRKAIGIEIEERYCEIAAKRLAQGVFDFGGVK